MPENLNPKVVPLRADHPSNFKRPATALKTVEGYMVNYGGFCFFTDEFFNYQPWKKTKQKGLLPPNNEFGRLRALRDENGNLLCKEISLNEEQMMAAFRTKLMLDADRFFGLTRVERFTAKKAYAFHLKKKLLQKAKLSTAKPKKERYNDFSQLAGILRVG
ncbi:MAG: hypothetical protein JWM92_229 [Candidatus Nomurabacteria bacterium]|nr:hypothetical protein [Candidatus Nomurabacteria bacterium]